MMYSYIIICVCCLVIPAMSYVKKSFSINSAPMDESDTDVSSVTYKNHLYPNNKMTGFIICSLLIFYMLSKLILDV